MSDLSPRSSRSDGCPLVRAEARVDRIAPGTFLGAFDGLPRGMWERDGSWCAWAGSAASVTVGAGHGGGRFRAVRRWAQATAERVVEAGAGRAAGGGRVRFHGGFAFDPARTGGAGPDVWSGFPAALFHLPAVELCREGAGARLAVTLSAAGRGGPGAAAGAARRALRRVRARLGAADGRGGALGGGEARRGAPGSCSAAGPPEVGGGALSVEGRPGPGRWAELVESALARIRSEGLEKVVPARMLEVELAQAPDPVAVTERLRADNPDSFPYLVEPDPGRAFAGAAPEIVAALHDGRFHATAVAGTVADSPDPGERERLAQRLLASAKDRREHEIGVRDMRRALHAVTGVARVDEEPRVLPLQGVQHLLTNVAADVSPEMHVLELLEAMHPTAAVNGAPREAALAFLRREEPFARGWYAGPVGWFDASGDGEFAPGLRSALLRGRRARMFAGAGIVAGSEAGPEWAETGLKFRPVVEALGIDAGRLTERRAGPVASGARPAPDL